MNIVSFNFLMFISIVIFLYYIYPKKHQWVILLLFSLVFYLLNSSITYILISAIITYFSSIKLNKKKSKLLLFLSITINLSLLVILKYNLLDYVINGNIIVPLGISYYTLTSISYLVDSYNKKIKPEGFFKFLLCLSFFPTLIEGPIVRFSKIEKSLFSVHRFDKDYFVQGLTRIVWGFFKKLVIANRIALITTYVVSHELGGLSILVALLLYGIEIYMDFSAGIDIVIGFAKILQVELEENFNTPYFSKSLNSFWKRWHMSLTNWYRDYVYIPLGGNRCSKIRNMFNILIVFILSGIWHGVGINFFLWGLFNGIIMILERLFKYQPKKKIFILVNYIVICLLWIFFLYPNFDSILVALNSLIPLSLTIPFMEIMSISNYVILIFSCLFIFIIEYLKYKNKISKFKYRHGDYLLLILLLFVIILFGNYGIGFDKTNFIYNRF